MKKRHILSKEFKGIQKSVEILRRDLNINVDDFKPLNINQWKMVEKNINNAFLFQDSQSTRRQSLWYDFKTKPYQINCKADPYKKLNLLIDKNESVYFFANEGTKYWFYEGKINVIITILDKAYEIDEYYLCDKKYNWLIGNETHDVLIGVGSIISKMKENEEELRA